MRESYIEFIKNPSNSVIVLGDDGTGYNEDALGLCASLLSVTPDKLFSHPDFLLVCSSGDSHVIKVDDVAEMRSRAALLPSVAKRRVFFIRDGHEMNQTVQNSILKLLEDSNNVTVVISTCSKAGLYDTIISRSRLLKGGRGLGDSDFLPGEDKELITELCLGRLEWLSELRESGGLGFLKRFFETLQSNQAELLNVAGLLKEKDSEYFVEKYGFVCAKALYEGLYNVYVDSALYSSGGISKKPLIYIERASYMDALDAFDKFSLVKATRADWFNLLRRI